MRLRITIDIERRRPEVVGEREVQLDSLVETQGPERIGFTIPGPSRQEDE